MVNGMATSCQPIHHGIIISMFYYFQPGFWVMVPLDMVIS